MRRPRILILFALILILGAAAVYLVLSGSGGEEPPSEGAVTPQVLGDLEWVAVAAQDIGRGSMIPEDGVIVSRMAKNLIVETMISGPDEDGVKARVIDHIARIDIARGVILTEAMFTEESGDLLAAGSDASLAIPAGQTAIAIPISRLSGVAYAVRDGDAVDVIITLLMVDVDQDFQSTLPNLVTPIIAPGGTEDFPAPFLTAAIVEFKDEREGAVPPFILGRVDTEPELDQQVHVFPQEAQRPRLVSQRLVEGAVVLHVGTFPLEERQVVEVPQEGVGAPTPGDPQATTITIQPPDIITLIVSPQDALALNWAIKAGADLSLTLRAPHDTTTTETTSLTLQYLVETYEVDLPSKLPYSIEPKLIKPIIPKLPNDTSPAPPSQ